MENNANNPKKGTDNNSTVEKVAQGRRASLGDEPLTPSRKMQAEESRMKNGTGETEERSETDHQLASLGSEILTPQRKMERARQEAQANQKSGNRENQKQG